MNGIDILLLHMLHKLKGERSIAGPYYILKGKKSGQAIQDASLFGYVHWFGLYPEWERQDFEQSISHLILTEKMSKREERYLLTPRGEADLYEKIEVYQLNSRGFRLSDYQVSNQEIDSFWNQFLLLSQVVSHYVYRSQHYSPIVTDVRVQAWVKKYWQSTPSKENLLLDLREVMEQASVRINDELLLSLLLDSLSGYQLNGRTIHQLAVTYKLPIACIRLYLRQAIGLLYISIQDASFSSLKSFFSETQELIKLTKSSQMTKKMLDQGYDVEQISRLRQLKMSTIEDHVIEIAIHFQEFDIARFIPREQRHLVREISHKLNSKKLSVIKEYVGDKLSYFQIRLALVREGEYDPNKA